MPDALLEIDQQLTAQLPQMGASSAPSQPFRRCWTDAVVTTDRKGGRDQQDVPQLKGIRAEEQIKFQDATTDFNRNRLVCHSGHTNQAFSAIVLFARRRVVGRVPWGHWKTATFVASCGWTGSQHPSSSTVP